MPTRQPVINILFLCTGNSCRSQMAEGWARRLLPNAIHAYSAGVAPGILDATAVQVMAEAGVDISQQRPKHLRELAATPFDYVITVCDNARESCPIFPGGTRVVHRPFDDPPRLAKSASNDRERLALYRRVRDEIQAMVAELPNMIASQAWHMKSGSDKEVSS